MSVNKNFIVKNGIEVNNNLIFANVGSNKVGIGTTIVNYTLDVKGGIGATDLYLSGSIGVGITNSTNKLHVIGNSYISGFSTLGIGATTESFYAKDVSVSGVSTFNNNIFIPTASLGIGIGTTTIPLQKFQIGAANTLGVSTDGKIFVVTSNGDVGIGTTNPTNKLVVKGDVNVSGATTSNSYSIGSTQVISSGRELQNILSLDAVTTATIESAIQNAPNTFTDLQVTGISTLGVTSTTDLTTQQLNVSGVSTLGVTTFTGNVSFGTSAYFGTNDKLIFGDSNDLQIFYDGNYSRIWETGAFGLEIRTNQFFLSNQSGDESIILATENSSVELYHNNTKRIETTGAGVTVTGTTFTNQLNVSGISTLGISTITGDMRFFNSADLYLPYTSSIILGDNGDFNISTNSSETLLQSISSSKFLIRNQVGTLDFQSNEINYLKDGGSEYMMRSFADGSVELYYDNSKKFETIGAGVTVTGTTFTNQLNVSGVSTFNGTVNFNSANISGDLTFANANGDIYLKDNGVINFGDGNDLQIFHNSSVSIIRDNGTGGLLIDSDNEIKLAKNGTGSDTLAIFTPDGSVELYYDNTKKFETLGAGVTVTGTTFTNQLSVSGVSTFIGSITGTISTATKLENSRTFEITGDVVASAISFDGTGNVSLAATIQPNSVGLGTDTFGDYVKDISGTANEIIVTGGTGEGSSPIIGFAPNPTIGGNVTIGNDLQVNNNLNVTGNITVGGTAAYILVENFRVSDADIILGFTTDSYGNDASTDTTANHGGIAVASTEGNPLVQLVNVSIGETLPVTYKKFMWFEAGSFAGLNTDAWLSNYAIGIGSTQFPSGTRLAAGAVQFSEHDLTVIRNINASGVITSSSFVKSGGSSSEFLKADGSIDSNVYLTTTGNGSSLSGIVTSLVAGTNITLSGSTGQVTINATGGGGGGGIVGLTIKDEDNIVGTADSVTTLNFVGANITATASGTASTITFATQTYVETAGIATYATSAGIATYASTTGIATYATTAGIATYATLAGVSTNVIGGIASVTQLSVSGVSTFSNTINLNGNLTFTNDGDITLKDNGILYFGDSNDLQILHNGSVSIIREGGTGGLLIDSNNEIKLAKNGTGSDTLAIFTPDGSVELYYDNTKTFETTGYGATVYGTLQSQQLNITGVSTLGAVRISSGIITATSGIVTYYGDGSKLTGVTGSQWVTTTAGIHTLSSVGIGTTNPTSKLHVIGDAIIVGVVTVTDINSTSDINLKDNIHTVENSIDIVNHLRGVKFDWKKDSKSSYGVIAQEVEKVLPELVTDTDPKTVNYNGLIGVLIEAVKELSAEVENLKAQINK